MFRAVDGTAWQGRVSARSQVQLIWKIHRRRDFLRRRHCAVVRVVADVRRAEALQLNDQDVRHLPERKLFRTAFQVLPEMVKQRTV